MSLLMEWIQYALVCIVFNKFTGDFTKVSRRSHSASF